MGILLVDHDGKTLAAMQRVLRKITKTHIALDVRTGLQRLAEEGPFSVVFAEFSMPDMDGVTFLRHVRQHCPNATRVLLCREELNSFDLLRAINEAGVFHVLSNPCADEILASILVSAITQHELATAQYKTMESLYVIFAKAVHDFVCWLREDVREMVGPVLPLLRALSRRLNDPSPALTETALLVSIIGLISLPPDILERVLAGEQLTDEDYQALVKHPQRAEELVSHLPQFHGIRNLLHAYAALLEQCGHAHSTQCTRNDIQGMPRGAVLLALVMEYRLALYQSTDPEKIFTVLGESHIAYPQEFLAALREESEPKEQGEIPLRLDQLRPGMIAARAVYGERDRQEIVMVPEGYEFSRTTLIFLRQFVRHGAVREPIFVRSF